MRYQSFQVCQIIQHESSSPNLSWMIEQDRSSVKKLKVPRKGRPKKVEEVEALWEHDEEYVEYINSIFHEKILKSSQSYLIATGNPTMTVYSLINMFSYFNSNAESWLTHHATTAAHCGLSWKSTYHDTMIPRNTTSTCRKLRFPQQLK